MQTEQQATLTYPLCSSCSLLYHPCDWEPQDLVVVAAVEEELVLAFSSSVDQPVSWVRSRKHNEGWEGLVCMRSYTCATRPSGAGSVWKECCVILTVQVCFSQAGRRGLEYLLWSWDGTVMLFQVPSFPRCASSAYLFRHFWRIIWVKKWPLVLPKVSEITYSFGIGETSVAQGSGSFPPLHVDVPGPAWATLCPPFI